MSKYLFLCMYSYLTRNIKLRLTFSGKSHFPSMKGIHLASCPSAEEKVYTVQTSLQM